MGDKSPKSKERQQKQDSARKHQETRTAAAKAAPRPDTTGKRTK